jgi:hypothetical protein
MNKKFESIPEIDRLIRVLEMMIINFGLSGGPKLDDSSASRLDIISLLEVLCESRRFILDKQGE